MPDPSPNLWEQLFDAQSGPGRSDQAGGETRLAAMHGQATFEGRAKLNTCLIGILKFRIVGETGSTRKPASEP